MIEVLLIFFLPNIAISFVSTSNIYLDANTNDIDTTFSRNLENTRTVSKVSFLTLKNLYNVTAHVETGETISF